MPDLHAIDRAVRLRHYRDNPAEGRRRAVRATGRTVEAMLALSNRVRRVRDVNLAQAAQALALYVIELEQAGFFDDVFVLQEPYAP